MEDEELACPVIVRRHHVREPQRLPRPVEEEALKRFFSVIKDRRDRAMFLLMLRCGLRIGEVAALQLADLFLGEEYPRLVVRGKGSRERGVYLSRQAKLALQDYLAERPSVKSEFVFLSYLEKGLSTTAIHDRLLKYACARWQGFKSLPIACGIPLPTTCSTPMQRSPRSRNSWDTAGSRARRPM